MADGGGGGCGGGGICTGLGKSGIEPTEDNVEGCDTDEAVSGTDERLPSDSRPFCGMY